MEYCSVEVLDFEEVEKMVPKKVVTMDVLEVAWSGYQKESSKVAKTELLMAFAKVVESVSRGAAMMVDCSAAWKVI